MILFEGRKPTDTESLTKQPPTVHLPVLMQLQSGAGRMMSAVATVNSPKSCNSVVGIVVVHSFILSNLWHYAFKYNMF